MLRIIRTIIKPIILQNFNKLTTCKHFGTQKKNEEKELSFTLNTFKGIIESSQIFPYPDVLTNEGKETLSMLIDPANRFFSEVNDPAANDDTASVPENVTKGLWEMGVFGLQVPAELGGLGLNNTQYARMVEIVGSHDLSVGIILGAHQSIGFKGILLYGTPEQKEKYLPRVCNGEFAAFCLTEPSAGSDAGSIKTRAVLSDDQQHYILNGSKIWISNGGWAEIMTVFAQTTVDDAKTGKKRDKVTAFIVERAFGGVTNGPPEKKMGIKSSNTSEVYYENVKIPIANILGGVGNGFKVAMNILNNGRFGMAAALAGTMKSCIHKAVEFVTNRVQFGEKLENYQGIQEKIARMAMVQYITESMAYSIAGNMDEGSKHYHIEAAISKCFAAESAWFVCDEAIQIMGGMGFMKETGLERVLRDLRIFRIFEGTNDILRLFVALNGVKYAGDNLKELQKAFKNPVANLGIIFGEASKRVVKRLGMESTKSFNGLVHPELVQGSMLMSKAISHFAGTVEKVLMKYNKNIIHQQSALNRLADVAVNIYGATVALSRASRSLNQNIASSRHEKMLADAICFDAYFKIMYNLKCVQSKAHFKHYENYTIISKHICENGGIIHLNPLGF